MLQEVFEFCERRRRCDEGVWLGGTTAEFGHEFEDAVVWIGFPSLPTDFESRDVEISEGLPFTCENRDMREISFVSQLDGPTYRLGIGKGKCGG